MPKFILPEGVSPVDYIHAIDVRRLENTTEIHSHFSTTSIYPEKLSFSEKWALAGLFQVISSPANGTLVPYLATREFVEAFDNLPNRYTIDLNEGSFDTFLERAAVHPSPDPAAPSSCFHIYIGKKTGQTNFNIVIVPAFFDDTQSDHKFDKEKSAFVNEPFFAFVISPEFIGISENVATCGDFIVDKDLIPANNATEVVFYSLDAFMDFKNNLEETPSTLLVEFGRDNERCILILTFLDGNTNPIICNITTPAAQGVCFDQGDLMPPPPKASDWDSSFA